MVLALGDYAALKHVDCLGKSKWRSCSEGPRRLPKCQGGWRSPSSKALFVSSSGTTYQPIYLSLRAMTLYMVKMYIYIYMYM